MAVPSSSPYDVFLSHSSVDKPRVEELARRLKQAGIEPFLDKWNLIPGQPWQEALEEALGQSAACAVIIGSGPFGPWHHEEMRAALEHRVNGSRGKFPVIPVRLPAAEQPRDHDLPMFLKRMTWVEFQKGLDDEPAFHRLVCGIRGIAPGPGPGQAIFEGECPYRGLEVFEEKHARFFFGREAQVGWLLGHRLAPMAESSHARRFLAVLGPSGSGKSSLALAGLIPALRAGKVEDSAGWPIVVFRPGPNPLESLAIELAHIGGSESSAVAIQGLISGLLQDRTTLHVTARLALRKASAARLVLLADQFEEVFTLCADESARRAFIANLLHAATVVGGPTLVLLTMRVDFLGKCAAYPDLAAALSDGQELVGPMSEDELRLAIERPAELAGCALQQGLTDLLLQDVQGQAGALPLLEYTLLEIWNRRQGRRLTVAAYKELGGVQGALEKRADGVLKKFIDTEQEVCRRIFLRLTRPGEGTEDTKRRASFDELIASEAERATVEEVVHKLADARLITTEGRETPVAAGVRPRETEAGESPAPLPSERQPPRYVEVAHEALIRGWSQLRQWIDADRAGLRLRLQLTAAAHEWEEHAGDAGYLYQGTRLAVARERAEAHPQELNFEERKFLEAGVQHELYLKASQLVEAIRVAETKDVPPLVKQLADRRLWEAKKQLLDPIIMNSDGDSKEHLHASLALLPEDDEQVEYLYRCLLKAGSTEFPVIRDALKQYQERLVQERLVERLWRVLEQPKDEGQYLQAASALALYDQSNPRWQKVGGKVAQALVTVNVVYLSTWLNALRPARDKLTDPLATIFRDKKHSETERSPVMNILADYASDQPTLLADLLMDSEEKPFGALFDKLKTHQDLAVRPLEDELAKPSPSATEVDDQAVERKKDVLAQRQARAAVALMRLEQGEKVWNLLRHRPDPSVRSYIVNWLKPLGAGPEALMTKLEGIAHDPVSIPKDGKSRMDAILFHPETSMRRALILALGGYNPDELSTDKREPLVEQLLEMYRNDPDAGIHGAAEWTLRRWKHDEKLAAIDVELKKLKDQGNRRWYVNSEGQTLAVIEGPIEFSMGSPVSGEPDRDSSETPHRQPINRRFAIATKEVTVEQYQKIARLEIDKYSPEPTGPMNRTTWYEAAAYCNWLSQQEGLATCYQPNDEGEFAEGMKIVPDALEQPGYRLPTEAEWEYACRAGAVTSRYYGRSVELLGKYAWYSQNSQDRAWPCGQLLPNELGLFDMLGNVYEWCHEQDYRYPEGEGNTTTDDMNILLSIKDQSPRLLRGGRFDGRPVFVRSAVRYSIAPVLRNIYNGFRPSRTYH